MRISRLELADDGDCAAVGIEQPDLGLNVVTGGGAAGQSALAACAAHLLYGRRTSILPQPPGIVDIVADPGAFRLRRESQPGGPCRLTITSLCQSGVTSETIPQLLRGCPADFLSGLYYINGDQAPPIDWLLSESVAENVSRVCGLNGTCSERLGQDTMLAQRDEFADQVAKLLAERRRTSETIARHLDDLARRRSEVLAAIERTREEHHCAEIELAQLSARDRYRELESLADESARAADQPDDRLRLDEIDDQIERWRTTLHDLERRESQVRTELARHRPIESAPTLTLADQRAALAVTERLVKDLQSEIARFAKSVTSTACVCRDAHPRIQPLITLLDQQVSRLVLLTDEHDRAARSQELQLEAQHLARSQAELRDQLALLQTQRESLSRRARPRRWPTDERKATTLAQQSSESIRELGQKHHDLATKLEALRRQLRELDQRRDRALAERTTILSDRVLEQKQAELAEIQRRLQPTRSRSERLAQEFQSSHYRRSGTRCSDYLAQLSEGRFVELKLTSNGRRAVVVDRHAGTSSVGSLPPTEQHLVSLSLSFAIIAGLGDAGFQMPVILDEPFAHLSDRQSAILAGVLRDFASQQVFVFTDRQAAIEHFRGWGIKIHNLSGPSRPAAAPPPVIRDLPDDEPARSSDPPRRTTTLKLTDSIESFPVLGNETRKALEPANLTTIGDLLAADPTRAAKRIARRQVTPSIVALWQSHAGLLCFVPELTLDDAQVLTSVGIHSTEQLAKASARSLHTRMVAYLTSDRGQRFVERAYQSSRPTVQQWIQEARDAALQFGDNATWKTWLRGADERRELSLVERAPTGQKPALRIKRERPAKKRQTKTVRDDRGNRQRNQINQSTPKYFLELDSPVAHAPSIAPDIAEQLSLAGIRQVRELLAADASKLVARLAEGEITAVDVVGWQHQARLCCRIPNLRANEAAILVGAGFSTPEDVASMKPAELHGFIESFAHMKEGRQLLGDDGEPDLTTIENWIRAARHSRALGAA